MYPNGTKFGTLCPVGMNSKHCGNFFNANISCSSNALNYDHGCQRNFRGKGAARNKRAIKTKGKGNELKNCVWKIFVTIPFTWLKMV